MTINRHPKQLQSKSRKHNVVLVNPETNHYQVTSGTSAKVYNVNLFNDGTGGCDCEWAKWNAKKDTTEAGSVSGCSHVIAALDFAAEDRTVYVWASDTDASRQHNVTQVIGDGLTITMKVRS